MSAAFDPGFRWTPEKIATAKRLYVDEGKGGTEVARTLGTTKNALIAKAHRMGWAGDRPAAAAAQNSRKNASRSKASVVNALNPLPAHLRAKPGPVVITGVQAQSRPATLLELGAAECHWPVEGEGAETLFCGAPALGGYCHGHGKVAGGKMTPVQMQALERLVLWVEKSDTRVRRVG